MPMRICGDCDRSFYQRAGPPARLCPDCRSAEAKRYSWAHRNARADLLADYVPGATRCARGGEVLHETDLSQLHADHRDDGRGYLGLSCAAHNCAKRPPVKVPWTTTQPW
jgi:hypothetical protein